MLIEFSVGNYRSFWSTVTLSMQAAKLRSGDKTVDANSVFEMNGLRLLRSAAIYGANASGKSNLVRAMAFMRRFVLQSSKESQSGEPIEVERFRLNTAAGESPAYFQIIFDLDGRRYRYGFELDNQRVRTEWLYRTVQREVRLFIREGDQYNISGAFKEGQGLQERTRPNALFLSVAAQFNASLAIALLEWFRTKFNTISGLNDDTYGGFTLNRFEADTTFRDRVLGFVRQADLGISDIRIETRPISESHIPDEVRLVIEEITKRREKQSNGRSLDSNIQIHHVTTSHPVFDQDHHAAGSEIFDMGDQESEGTQKIFLLSGPLLDTLDNGTVLVIDEMEARLHPLITRTIISLFNSLQTNPHNAQLVFVTHDTGLLNSRFFRRDQIWFAEKDRYGATDLYSLAELQVRNDASFDKDYIAGKYGAVPFIGGLHSLFEDEPDGETI
ncbi:ATP-binding protein [candidate division KSB1 bacterium]|nr:MAG: ATP-binding protein [candidate division KSB1 bacterium]